METVPGIDVARELYGENYELINRYVDILISRGIDWGLLGPREVPRVWERHILNSAAMSEVIPREVAAVDVGSGAGLPGLPLAILRPDLQVTLLEPLLRRATFLEQAVEELGLGEQVRVVRERAEDHRDKYDVVLSRAVAPLDRLVGWCAPLMAPSASMLALKGQSAADEIEKSQRLLFSHRLQATVLTVRAHAAAESTTVVRVTKA